MEQRVLDGLQILLNRNVTTSRWTFVFDTECNLIYKNSVVKAGQDRVRL